MTAPSMTLLKIKGYRPFRDFTATLGSLEVLVGANGAGKSALFEFLKFLRDSTYHDSPPEIIHGSIGQAIFHQPGGDRLWWSVRLDLNRPHPLQYQGEILGPIGKTQVIFERVLTVPPEGKSPLVFLDMKGQSGIIRNEQGQHEEYSLELRRKNQLALSTATNPNLPTLYLLRETLLGWRFYSSFRINHDKIRKPVPIEENPTLDEDAGNLSAVLFYLSSEHPHAFEELHLYLRAMIPHFQRLTLKARGRGEVIAFWQERGVQAELSLADVSDGILRLLCWSVLALTPTPPSLICIDEPDQGVHPRTLPILAGMFQRASERTQILIATHASYFVKQFDLSTIAVMRKEEGQAVFRKPADSDVLKALLEDFGTEDLEYWHQSDQLEDFA